MAIVPCLPHAQSPTVPAQSFRDNCCALQSCSQGIGHAPARCHVSVRGLSGSCWTRAHRHFARPRERAAPATTHGRAFVSTSEGRVHKTEQETTDQRRPLRSRVEEGYFETTQSRGEVQNKRQLRPMPLGEHDPISRRRTAKTDSRTSRPTPVQC